MKLVPKSDFLLEDFYKLPFYDRDKYLLFLLLKNRGLVSKKDIHLFFHGKEFLLPNICSKKNDVLNLLRDVNKILVYGDYDVDGISSTVLTSEGLKSLGYEVSVFIPDRFEHGYGLHSELIEDKEFDLLITVDTGITAIDDVNRIKDKNKKVIIIDHHQIVDNLPEADIIIHPSFDSRIDINVSGSFMSLQFIYLLYEEVPFDFIFLGALGTLSDQMPLLSWNRNLIRYVLSSQVSDYVKRLFFEFNFIDLYDWSFKLIPMLNSCGRLGQTEVAYKLLSFCSNEEFYDFYRKAKELNVERKNYTDKYKKAIEEKVQKENLYENNVILVCLEDGHEGLNGILSSYLSNKYKKPSIVLSKSNKGFWVGSGRSIYSNIYSILLPFKNLFKSFGGHKNAVGLQIDDSILEEFSKRILDIYLDEPVLEYEFYLPIELLTFKFLSLLDSFKPYGVGNPEPVFMSKITVQSITPLSNGKFFKIKPRESKYVEFLCWYPYNNSFQVGDELEIVYVPRFNEFRGEHSISCQVLLCGGINEK